MARFNDLNDDVLIYLFRLILETDESKSGSRVALVPLSSTCRQLRDLSKPVMFRRIHRSIGITPPTTRFFLRQSLWSYVQHLTITDYCAHRERGRDKLNQPYAINSTPDHVPHLYACEVFLGPVIKHILRRMPLLTKLSLCTHMGVVHGPIWTFLRRVFSLPHLREFEMTGLTFCPVLLPTEVLKLKDGICAPLTAFRYEAILTRGRRYALSAERDALSLVLEHIHDSLVTLTLPSEPAPIPLISRWDWPNLRELKLRGMRWPEPRTPFVLLFVNMPRLRSLVLELALPDDAGPEALWPPGLPQDTKFPWPELEELTVANLHPDDKLFSHLPQCLRTLALPSCPRKCVKEWLWKYEGRYRLFPHTFYLVAASELLDVLKRCSTSGLTYLEIEYGADERECDLLRYLVTKFPGLSSLTLYRYQANGETVVRVEDVVCPLAPLTCLRTIYLHLDLETRPSRTHAGWIRGGQESYDTDVINEFIKVLEGVALQVARTLSASLQRMILWMPGNRGGPVAANFSVFRDHHGVNSGLRIQREAFTCHEREDVWGI